MRNVPLLSVGRVKLILLRKNKGSYNDIGEWVENPKEKKVEIIANVQPAGYQEIRMLPEAQRSSKAIQVFSKCELRVQKEGTDGYASDEFVWEGDTYKVMKVEHYAMGILNHYHAICSRIELTP